MKKLTFLFGLFSLSFLSSCGDPAPASNDQETVRIPVVLTEDDLFKGNIILAVLQNDDRFVQEANDLFLQGINAFRNEKDLDSATIYLKKSIMKDPSPNAYFELGNVYMDKKEFDNAMLAYGVAEQLDYEPMSKILYNKACAYSLQKKNEMAGKYLEYALQAGYTNIEHINKDSDLENLRETGYYRQALDKGLRGMSNPENLYWLQFKKQFAPTQFPLKLSYNLSEKEFNNLKFISYEYERYISEMRDEQFSREVSKTFYYYASAYETDKFVAVIYLVKDEFMGDASPYTYRMATFTHSGKLIDRKDIAGRQDYGDPIMTSTLKADRTIDVKLIEPTYEQDPDDHGFWDNKIVSTKTVGTMTFKIDSDGHIRASNVKDVAAN